MAPHAPYAQDLEGFYRRPLPEPSIAFASSEGRALFAEALAEGHMAGYFALAEQFHTQSEPAFCGLGTLVVVLNALQIDPGRLWRGPWRWFGEELLDCCAPLERVAQSGITLERLVCLARCNGAQAHLHPASNGSLAEFRRQLIEVARGAEAPHIVVSYSRAQLGQTGDGHFSPLAGYHRGRDMALILDVARFKYPPHWTPVERLWSAMHTEDSETGRSRGYVLLSRADQRPGLLAGLLRKKSAGGGLEFDDPAAIHRELSAAWVDAQPPGVLELAKALDTALCARGLSAKTQQAQPEAKPHAEALESAWQALVTTELYRQLERKMQLRPASRAAVALIMLAAPQTLLEICPPDLRRELKALAQAANREPLTHELEWLRLQWDELARCP